MKQQFTCLSCNKKTELNMRQKGGILTAQCHHCKATHEIEKVGGHVGGPVELKAARIIS